MLFFIFQIRFSYCPPTCILFIFFCEGVCKFSQGIFIGSDLQLVYRIKAFYECISVSLAAVSYKLLHVFGRYHYVLLAIRFALPTSLA